MGKIFCLMGKSSSGKDSIFKRVKDTFQDELSSIILYTTRPMRKNEVQGREYHFIDEQKLKEYEKGHKVIEQRVYHTVEGPWYYATIDDGQVDLVMHNYITIVTLEAYINLKNYYGEDKIVPIYIDVENGLRLERALKRERQQDQPNYDEMCRRFLADNKDFSEQNLAIANITRIYVNENIDSCTEEIIATIRNMM